MQNVEHAAVSWLFVNIGEELYAPARNQNANRID
jgi:hypothetical protein